MATILYWATDIIMPKVNKYTLFQNTINEISTYPHLVLGSHTFIDRVVSDPSVFLDFTSTVDDDLIGTDHLSIIPILRNQFDRTGHRFGIYTKQIWQVPKFLRASIVSLYIEGLLLSYLIFNIFCMMRQPHPQHHLHVLDWKNMIYRWFHLIKARKRTLRLFKSYPTADNLDNVHKFRAKARYTSKRKIL